MVPSWASFFSVVQSSRNAFPDWRRPLSNLPRAFVGDPPFSKKPAFSALRPFPLFRRFMSIYESFAFCFRHILRYRALLRGTRLVSLLPAIGCGIAPCPWFLFASSIPKFCHRPFILLRLLTFLSRQSKRWSPLHETLL